MLLKDEFLSRWTEVSGFDFRKLLEDNQNLSLPMITLIDNAPAIFAFIYSYLPNGKIIVSQRHIWSMNEHRIMLCKTPYKISINDISVDEKSYLEVLSNAVELLFKDNLSSEEKAICERYFSYFDNEYLKLLYYSENKSLFQWATKYNLL